MLLIVKDLGDALFRCLLTIVPPHPSKEGVTLQQELIKGGIPVFKSMVRRTSGFEKAAMEGVPLRDMKDPRFKQAWQDYVALGNEVMEFSNEQVR